MDINIQELFIEALVLANGNFYVEAASKFLHIYEQSPDSDLADDALYNAGMCYFNLDLFERAIGLFELAIKNYPDADIWSYEGGHSFGKTAAKCYYAILNCYLGLANPERAKVQIEKLAAYEDSYELTALGQKITYLQLGLNALDSFKQFDI